MVDGRTDRKEVSKPAAGLTATQVRFTRGVCRRIIRDYTRELPADDLPEGGPGSRDRRCVADPRARLGRAGSDTRSVPKAIESAGPERRTGCTT